MKFIERDIPNWKNKPHEPANPQSWHKVYEKLKTDAQRDLDEDTARLRASMGAIKTKHDQDVSKSITGAEMPRMPTKRPIGANRRPQMTSPGFRSGQKAKVLTGKGVLDRARKEAIGASLFSSKNSRLNVPTHLLSSSATRIRNVPPGFVPDRRVAPKPIDPAYHSGRILVPRRKSSYTSQDPTMRERERRLQAIKNATRIEDKQLTDVSVTEPVQDRELSSSKKRRPVEKDPSELLSPPEKMTNARISVRTPSPGIGGNMASISDIKTRSLSPSNNTPRPVAKRAPANIFMPAKKRKII